MLRPIFSNMLSIRANQSLTEVIVGFKHQYVGSEFVIDKKTKNMTEVEELKVDEVSNVVLSFEMAKILRDQLNYIITTAEKDKEERSKINNITNQSNGKSKH